MKNSFKKLGSIKKRNTVSCNGWKIHSVIFNRRLFIMAFTVISAMLLSINSSAQITNVTYGTPQSADVCQTVDGFHISFETTQTVTLFLHADVINQLSQPPGMSVAYPNPPCNDQQQTNPNYPVSIVLNSTGGTNYTLSSATLIQDTLYQISVTLDTIALTEVTIEYDLYFDCSLIPGNTGPQLVLEQDWSAINNSGGAIAILTQPKNISILYPHLVSLAPSNYVTVPGNYGQSNVAMIFPYQNNGYTSATIQFNFRDVYQDSCQFPSYSVDTLKFGTGTTTSLPVTYSLYNSGGVNSITIDTGEVLYIVQIITIDTCITNCVSDRMVTMDWRCKQSAAPPVSQRCLECQMDYVTTFGFQNETPSFTLQRITPSFDRATFDTICSGDTTLWRIRVKNTSQFTTLDYLKVKFFHANFNFGLSVVDQGSASTVLYCNDCSSTSSYSINSSSPCDDLAISNPVDTMVLEVFNFAASDSVEFIFPTYRCCTENSDLVGNAKYFNHWKFSAIAESRECGLPNTEYSPTVLAPTIDAAYNNSPSNGVSSHSSNPGHDIHLETYFNTTTTHMDVPPEMIFGTSKECFAIEMQNSTSFFGNLHDMQILGYTPSSQSLSGIFRAQIHCDRGLLVDSPLDVEFIYVNGVDTLIWTPVAFHDSLLQGKICRENSFYWYYDLSRFGYDTIVNFLDNGTFTFKLLACCDSTPAQSNYEVLFSLLPKTECFAFNPSNTPPCSSSGDCCWLPLSSEGSLINVHCPGCKAPGIIVDNYYLQRTSFGFEDKNDDHVADNDTIIDPDNYLDASGNPLKLSRSASIFGDLIEDRLVAHFQDGDTTGGGYTYAMMTGFNGGSPGIHLNFLQLLSDIPYSDPSNMNLSVEGFDLYIDEVNAGWTGPCFKCDEFSGARGSAFDYHTTLLLSVNKNGLPKFFQRQNDKYLYTFSQFDLAAAISSGDAIYTLFGDSSNADFLILKPNQQYRLNVRYKVCGNISSSKLINPKKDDLEKTSLTDQKMWLIGDSISILEAVNDLVPQMPNTDSLLSAEYGITFDTVAYPNDSLVSQYNLANAFQFYCEKRGTSHDFYSTDYLNATVYKKGLSGLGGSCEKKITITTINSFRRSTINAFPNEYKSPGMIPDTFNVIIPGGYRLSNNSNSKIHTRYFTENTSSTNPHGLESTKTLDIDLSFLNYTCDSIDPTNEDTITFTLDQVIDAIDTTGLGTSPSLTCLLAPLPADTTSKQLLLGDEYHEFALELFVEHCSCPDSVYDAPRVKHTEILFGENTTCPASIPCDPSILPLPQYNMYAPLQWTGINPNLDIEFFPACISASTNTVIWHFQVTNLSLALPANAVTAVPNVFFNFDTFQPFLTNWQLLNVTQNGLNISPSQVGGSDTYILTSSMPKGAIIEGYISADYSFCTGNVEDTVNLSWGWNCDDQFNSSQICGQQDTILKIQKQPVQIVVDQNNTVIPTSYSLCKSDTLKACFKNISAGNVSPYQVNLMNYYVPAIGINSITIRNCNYPSNSQQFALSPPNFIIHDFMMDSLFDDTTSTGYMGLNDCICVLVDYYIPCTGGDIKIPDVELLSETYCLDTLETIASMDTVPWSAITDCDSCYTISKTTSESEVHPYQSINYYITICSFNGVNKTVTLKDSLPMGFVQDTTSHVFPLGNILLTVSDPCTTIVINGYFQSAVDSCNKATLCATAPSGNTISFDDVACISVYSECSQIADTSLSGPLVSSFVNLFKSGSTVEDKIINLSGTFNVDSDITFVRCELIMEPESEIIITTEGVSLTFDSTMVYACSDMWKGITFDNDATLNVGNLSEIRDANTAVRMSHPSTVNIEHSKIYDCVYGVYAPTNAADPTAYSNAYLNVESSEIGMKSTSFRPNYPGQPTHGDIPTAGMELHNMNFVLGGSNPYNTNKMYNMITGLVIHDCYVIVRNTEIYNINPDASYPIRYGGTAIISNTELSGFTLAKLRILGDAGIFNTIENSFKAIHTDGSSLYATHVHIEDVEYGIYGINHPRTLSTEVNNCNITALQYGIFWINNRDAWGMSAQYNTINVVPGGTERTLWGGIYAAETNNRWPVRYSINNNDVTVGNAEFGIRMDCIGYGAVRENLVTMEPAHVQAFTNRNHGIRLQDNDSMLVTCNIINGSYQHPDNNRMTEGISVDMSPRCAIGCNLAEDTEFGYHFYGQSPSTVFRGNEMKDHEEGLRLLTGAFIGNQRHQGNIWHGPFGGFAANIHNGGFQDAQANRFVVYGSGNANLIPVPFTPPTWFQLSSFDSTFLCTNLFSCDSMPHDSIPQDEEFADMVAGEDYDPLIYPEENVAIAEQYLYALFMSDSSLWVGDSLYESFVEEHENDEVNDLYQVEYSTELATKYDEVYRAQIETAQTQVQILQDSIALLDELFAQEQPLPNHEFVREQLTISIQNLNQTIANILILQEALWTGYIDAAQAENDNLYSSEIPYNNTQFINEIELLLLEGDTFAIENEYTSILSIAQQCPYSGGSAVYRARVMIAMINDSVSYNDQAVCLLSGILLRKAQDSVQVSDVQIFPNPANELLNITWNNIHDGELKFQILNLLGETVKTLYISSTESKFKISTSDLSSGIYYLQVNSSEKNLNGRKFVIQH